MMKKTSAVMIGLFASLIIGLTGCATESEDKDEDEDESEVGGGMDQSSLLWSIKSSLIVDVNKDGRNDIIVGSKLSGLDSDILLINNGDNSFTKKLMPPHYLGKNGNAVDLNAADFNNDGHIDIIAITVNTEQYYANSRINLYLGNGDGTFLDASDNITDGSFIGSPQYLRIDDFDKDGHIDFLTRGLGSNGTVMGRFT